jgi:hypothetical protein
MNLEMIKLKLKFLMSDINKSDIEYILSKKDQEKQELKEIDRKYKESESMKKIHLYSKIIKKR